MGTKTEVKPIAKVVSKPKQINYGKHHEILVICQIFYKKQIFIRNI